MNTEKSKPSLELTDREGEDRPNGPGSFVREDGELTRVGGTKNPNPFGEGKVFQTDEPSDPEPESESDAESDESVQDTLTDTEQSEVDAALEEVVTAIGLVDKNDSSLWTKNSGPKLSALESIIGHPITDDMRSIAWESHQESQEN